ncbi:MAG: hypothetical protein F6K17_24495 [Okeania sp. SIO3C4]|nr:hypothetical protein [Okeania sp. SIO3C4]
MSISGTYGSKGELTRDESLNSNGVPERYNFKPMVRGYQIFQVTIDQENFQKTLI